MSLSISYKNSHGSCLRPGFPLTGSVRFSSKKDEAISSVTLTFSGRCKVKIREHLHYTTRTFRSRGYYFYTTTQLFYGAGFTHKAGEYEWPFSLSVPEVAEPHHAVAVPVPGRPKRTLDSNGMMQIVPDDEHGHDHFPPKAPWRASSDLRAHPLPDTYMVVHSKWPVDFEAKVEYALIAKIERPGTGSKLFSSGRSQDLETVVDVDVRNALGEEGRELLKNRQTIEFEKWIGDGGGSKGIGKAWAKVAKSTADQKAKQGQRVVFTISMATAVQAQSTVPFVVKAVTAMPARDPGHDAPPAAHDHGFITATITDLGVSILRKTSARDDSRAATEHTAVKLDKEVMCWRRQQRNIDIVMIPDRPTGAATFTGEADLEDLIHVPALVPSFRTYNIVGEYLLEFELKITVLGETVTIHSSTPTPRVVVLPYPSGTNEDLDVAGDDKRAPHGKRGLEKTHHQQLSSKEAEAAPERALTQRDRAANGSEDEQLPAYEP